MAAHARDHKVERTLQAIRSRIERVQALGLECLSDVEILRDTQDPLWKAFFIAMENMLVLVETILALTQKGTGKESIVLVSKLMSLAQKQSRCIMQCLEQKMVDEVQPPRAPAGQEGSP